jgi:hypothetical protein
LLVGNTRLTVVQRSGAEELTLAARSIARAIDRLTDEVERGADAAERSSKAIAGWKEAGPIVDIAASLFALLGQVESESDGDESEGESEDESEDEEEELVRAVETGELNADGLPYSQLDFGEGGSGGKTSVTEVEKDVEMGEPEGGADGE